jgi:hypothetical protein
VEQLEHRWCPSFSLVTSRTALAGTDSVNWGTLGPNGRIVANPFTIPSTTGRSISVSKPTADGFEVLVQGTGWRGNFAPGDSLLWTHDQGSKLDNPITLDFGTTAVAAGGAQIQLDFQEPSFTAKVEAFDATGKSLASVTEQGISTSTSDDSAIFIGISSSSANISRIALSIKVGEAKGDFAINKFDFRTSPLTAAPPAAAPAIRQPAPPLDLAPLASSLLGTGHHALPVAPAPGPAAPSAPLASQSAVVVASAASSPAPAGFTDAIFAASHSGASDDRAWLFAPFSLGGLDAM